MGQATSAFWAALRPPERLTVSEWADKYRRLSAESSAEPGRWVTARAEYQRGIMDAISDPLVEEIVWMKSSQVGATEALGNVVGRQIHLDPAPILVIQPNQKPMAEDWSKDRLAPMVRDTPVLSGLVSDAKGKDSSNTILHKAFPGGHITIVGANSPAGLASRPIRVVLCDEVDRYPVSAGREGDPISLARKRARTFWNRKIVMASTPTIKGASRIEAAYEGSTQERYHVPCPHCGVRAPLEWGQVEWDDDDPESARYVCASCSGAWTEAHRQAAVRAGSWVADKPGRRVRGFHLSELYSPWSSIESIVEQYLAAKVLPETLKTWWNTVLGLPYEESGEQEADPDTLMARRESYPVLPDAARCVTMGVDVQNDRLEVEVVAHAETRESWSVDYHVLEGDPRIPPAESGSPWAELDELLDMTYAHESGGELRVWATCVDSGFLSDEVYRYCKRRARRRVYAIKGKAGLGVPANGGWSYTTKRKDERANRTKLWTVGVDTLKSRLVSRLNIAAPGPGYCHFPAHYEQRYFDQLTAEKAVKRVNTRGRVTIEWHQVQERNEALDCRVYAMAALEIRRPRWRAKVPGATARSVTSGSATASAPATSAPPERPEPTAEPPSPDRQNQRRRRALRIGGGGRGYRIG